MKVATAPRATSEGKLLVLFEDGKLISSSIGDLPGFFRKGDLLIVNDAATFPASLRGETDLGEPLEVRLLPKSPDEEVWSALLFGAGDWRMRTEDRPVPPVLERGRELIFGGDFRARVHSRSEKSPRLVHLQFQLSDAEVWKRIYSLGQPIQYSYLKEPLDLWSVQTSYSSRPWASEMPSAGRPLSWEVLLGLRKKGVAIKNLTHATGPSSTGDPETDALLPLPEFFHVPEETAEAIQRTRHEGGRVIAVGTSVVRALEGRAREGEANKTRTIESLQPGDGQTDLIIRKGFKPKVVDGILTGIHEPTETHFNLLEAFASREALTSALAEAEKRGYRTHEFGDSMLLFRAFETGVPS